MTTGDLGPLNSCGQPIEELPKPQGQADQDVMHRPHGQDTTRHLETYTGCQDTEFKEINAQDLSFLSPPSQPGELGWLGLYRVIKLLGEGGMGQVFLAEDPRLKRPVALKVMLPNLAKSGVARERFLREARATASIHSDHILAIHEIGQANDLPYIVTELLHGEPLNVWLKNASRQTPAQVVDIGLQIARGLEASHRSGVIHRDIKPANIWVEQSTNRIKIFDFGLARSGSGEVDLTQIGVAVGTPAYMAPEQAEGKPIDERCDLFSLGCVLYEAATGAKAFDGSSPVAIIKAMAVGNPTPLQELRADFPIELSNLIMQLLAIEREHRPASASAVVKALEEIAAGTSKKTHVLSSPGSQGSHSKSAKTRRGLQIAFLAGIAVAAVGVSFWVLRTHPFNSQAGADSLSPDRSAENATATNGNDLPTIVRGVSKDEILLGMSSPFSGPARELGRAMEMGIRTCFNHVNDDGGIAGRKLKLVVLDDGYEPDRALANMTELYEQRHVFGVIGNVGTPTAEKTMPYALAKKMVFFGAFTGATLLRRDPPDRYVFNYRASYPEETAALVKYLIEIKGVTAEQIAVFAQQDGYGDAGFNGVAKRLRQYGRRPEQILRVGHPRNTTDVSSAVQEILRHKEIRAVVMVSTYRPAAQFIRNLKDAKSELLFANVSFVGSDALADELLQAGPTYASGVIVSQVVPHPDSQATAVLKYCQLLQKYYPNELPSFGSLEGYIDAAIFAEGLRRAGANLTTETLIDALETIDTLDLGLGTPLRYGPSEHQASHKVWGTVLNASGHYQILELD